MVLTNWYPFFDPPGMMHGPFSAPSSPPETPVPMYRMLSLARSSRRRSVSVKSELPPSISRSPGSRCGRICAIISSTGAPALTMRMILRGRWRLAHSSFGVMQPMRFRPRQRFSMNRVTFDVVRLKTATE